MQKYFQSIYIFVFGITLFSAISAQAKIFRNAYITFELPSYWNCNLDQTEWICKSADSILGKRGVIALTAKEAGPTDSLAFYEQYLNKSLTSTAVIQGDSVPSKIIYKSKSTKIQDQTWLDALHIGSEFPGYYTRYLVTLHGQLSILITFTAHKENYAKFNQDFFQAISSLRIVASNDFLNKPSGIGGATSNIFGSVSNGLVNGGQLDLPEPTNPSKSGKIKNLPLWVGLFLIAAFSFLFFLKRRKRKY